MSSSIFRKRWSGFRWISVDDEETNAGSWHWEWNAGGIKRLWQKWRRTDKVISISGFNFTLPCSQGLSSYHPLGSPQGAVIRETLGTRLSLQYSGEIWKRRFHSRNASNVFRPRYPGEIWKCCNHRSVWICVWVKLSKCFSATLKHKTAGVLQISPVWRAFSINFRFRDGLMWTVGLTEMNLRFQIALDGASIFDKNGSHCNIVNDKYFSIRQVTDFLSLP